MKSGFVVYGKSNEYEAPASNLRANIAVILAEGSAIIPSRQSDGNGILRIPAFLSSAEAVPAHSARKVRAMHTVRARILR